MNNPTRIHDGRPAFLLLLALAFPPAGCRYYDPGTKPVPAAPGVLVLRVERTPPLALSVVPSGPAELRLQVKPKRPVAAPPSVEISVTGGRQLETFRTTLDRASSSYVVTAPITVGEQFMVVARARTRAGGVPLISMARLNTVLLDTRQVTTAFSADGQLSLTVPAGALPSGRWLVFGPAEAPAPRGRVLVREPRLIASGVSGERLAQRGILRFVLPDPQEGGAPPPFDPATARIERFDPRRERWEPQRSRFEPVPLSGGLFLETDRLGIYAVTARRR